jgi:hypothetical protein
MNCAKTGRLLKKKWFISLKPLFEQDPNSKEKD